MRWWFRLFRLQRRASADGAALARAEAAQDAERRAARQRLLDVARRDGAGGWDAAQTMALPIARPLLTPGQRARSRHIGHR